MRWGEDSIFDAPAGISGEARPAGGVEGVYGFHQANGADGNQIVLFRGESIVFLCDAGSALAFQNNSGRYTIPRARPPNTIFYVEAMSL